MKRTGLTSPKTKKLSYPKIKLSQSQENFMKQTAQELMTQTTFINLQGSDSPVRSPIVRQKFASPNRGGWNVVSPRNHDFSQAATKNPRKDNQFDLMQHQQLADPSYTSIPSPTNPIEQLSHEIDDLTASLNRQIENNRVDQRVIGRRSK